MATDQYDVAIIGGGPAGSTTGTFLRKYAPETRVVILEREKFPRDHVGESQLPGISHILNEMGVWDKVEAANFPVKIGGTYKWGKTAELWDFDFMPVHLIKPEPRPGKFVGQRRNLAFQVDRSIYDEILLDHAASLGCDVREETRVLSIEREGDRVTGLRLESGETITARWYVDASGNSGILRRAMGVEVEYPTALQNIAIWDYWQNASWAEEIGIGGTRIQVMSIGYGWIWFIPLGPTRTSIGLVVPKETLKRLGKTAEELYRESLPLDARIWRLMEGAESEGKLQTTRDWSFEADRHCGENWMLVGECAGFADPILSAGLTITHASGREAAFTLLSLDSDENPDWLLAEYSRRQKRRIRSHIQFADYWYTANTQFKDLSEHTSEIAREGGLELNPEQAWDWIARGGFILDEQSFGFAGVHFSLLKDLTAHMGDMPETRPVDVNNVFHPNLNDSVHEEFAQYKQGRVKRIECLMRDGKMWPLEGPYGYWYHTLSQVTTAPKIVEALHKAFPANVDVAHKQAEIFRLITALNILIIDGWVTASHDEMHPVLQPMNYTRTVKWHEADAPLQTVGKPKNEQG
ncbi:MAG TPA: NAD(P)/FAD-dependent oxidoreductase [Fimbriimonas sp.]|nr:NAD(P)/FAD-dependent oxidoreductase [Fimbriimonas sp.]